MGSGTTAVACIQSKRKYIGFDINTEYIKITEKRIEEEMADMATAAATAATATAATATAAATTAI